MHALEFIISGKQQTAKKKNGLFSNQARGERGVGGFEGLTCGMWERAQECTQTHVNTGRKDQCSKELFVPMLELEH